MNNDNPILNNPYEEPKYHYNVDINGNLDYSQRLEGRRPYIGNIQITPNGKSQAYLFNTEDLMNNNPDAKFINDLRKEVKSWREKGYPMVTRITRELLNFWFNNSERQNFQKLFFCQREAIETAVYLNEVAERDPNIGRNLLRLLDERRESVSNTWEDVLPRTAFKMATGTGKTVVMAMLILYHYLNKSEYHNDTRFADHFLLVAPGITIRDRLGVLMLDESAGSRYDKKDYYHQRGLIPRQYEKVLGGLNNAITITNYHQFEPKVYTGKKASPLDGKMVYCSGEGMVKQSDKEDFQSVLSRILGPGMKGKRFIVINDEAHHCYLPKEKEGKGRKDEETAEGEEENKRAMVWYEGLRQMKILGYKLQHVYDLSATPYYLKGSGYTEYSLFPWVVTDFGLVEAIESGLVKIPFLPSMDDSHDLEEPKLRNIYEHIRGELPKKGQKAIKKKVKEEAAANGTDMPVGEMPPKLPTLLTMALEQFVKDYEKYDSGMRQAGEAGKDLLTAPPVFIVVCNNTTVSKEVFKYIAGYETVDAEGNKIYREGVFPVFSNYMNGRPKNTAPSLLIDSSALDEASDTIDDEFKRVFHQEISEFKRNYALMHGAGSADQLTDGDILREVVNTVGKPGMLGGHIRCVVSVSMLTEGWDANTVTHVCGVRAFGSQLLCEQVAGRALRRRSYNLAPYDKRTGQEIPSKNLYQYSDKNIVYKFQPEYAHIIGVPFKTFKGGTAAPPQPPKPTMAIRPLQERNELEIVFPNIVGYRSERENSIIEADFSHLPKFKLDFTQIPQETILRTPIGDETKVLKTNYKEKLRDSQVVYELTRRLLSAKYRDEAAVPMFQKFAQLKAVVQKWYGTQVEIVGGEGDADARRLVLFWNPDQTNASIYEGISEHNRDTERIIAILNHYNPEGSTSHVSGATTKKVWPTVKSHINYVVADTDSWEQIAAKTLEEIPAVKKYVKNHFLDFKIPYMALNEEKNFVPDFIAVVDAPSGDTVNLIIEISGFSNDNTNFKEEKRHYTNDYWLPAANNLKKYGRWDFIEITDIDNIKPQLIAKINSL
ncbi:BPTD_3080 family restriction endonuclease [uncultured Bacteroides sp.]|uniref:BPTD_3080 family restriction endonuclease n=1 Tax=uncultured Bacteroides sp. TaxID=162156 RepID=UPI002611BA9B|nr:DEAD/DEAH box helicase family protein [uncultured Bacteroides sp.]